MTELVQYAPTPEQRFAARVWQARQLRRWSQRDLADELNAAGHTTFRGAPWDQTTVSRIEHTSRPIYLVEAVEIAALLDIEIES